MRRKVTNSVGTGRIARSNEFGDNLKEICGPSYIGPVWFHLCVGSANGLVRKSEIMSTTS